MIHTEDFDIDEAVLPLGRAGDGHHVVGLPGADEVNVRKVAGLVLILAGVLALVYRGFDYTKEDTRARLGPVELSVKQKERVSIPIWAGVGRGGRGGRPAGHGAEVASLRGLRSASDTRDPAGSSSARLRRPASSSARESCPASAPPRHPRVDLGDRPGGPPCAGHPVAPRVAGAASWRGNTAPAVPACPRAAAAATRSGGSRSSRRASARSAASPAGSAHAPRARAAATASSAPRGPGPWPAAGPRRSPPIRPRASRQARAVLRRRVRRAWTRAACARSRGNVPAQAFDGPVAPRRVRPSRDGDLQEQRLARRPQAQRGFQLDIVMLVPDAWASAARVAGWPGKLPARRRRVSRPHRPSGSSRAFSISRFRRLAAAGPGAAPWPGSRTRAPWSSDWRVPTRPSCTSATRSPSRTAIRGSRVAAGMPLPGKRAVEHAADQAAGLRVEHRAEDLLGPVHVDLPVEVHVADDQLPAGRRNSDGAEVRRLSRRSVMPESPSSTTRTPLSYLVWE